RAKVMARSSDENVRRKLAQRADLRPELLYYLAEDKAPDVRRAVADNRNTPVHADLILARDSDDDVRTQLAGKIAELAPDLSDSARGKLYDMTCQVIEILARDQLPRVRAVLAEALAEVTGASPRIAEVIRGLARDEVFDVAAPVLERSAVLTDQDLIEIINTDPAAWALTCIARRPEVSPTVADAVVGGGDVKAIAALLGNSSAQIREETLDRLVERAPDEKSWHGPLVRRPKLSPRSATRIAEFVADSLLDFLRQRNDLDPATTEAVSVAVKRRLDAAAKAIEDDDDAPAKSSRDAGAERAARLHADGKLDDDAIARAIAAGERTFVVAGLALRAKLPADVVRAMLTSGSAKAVVALAMRAEVAMRVATQMQLRLAGIAPASVLKARGDAYPLAEEDMQWQVEFFGG
ncbi:MAG: DUF2336 domain-containing protein, partial [Candidatus Eiseniibacteriota bacterium]